VQSYWFLIVVDEDVGQDLGENLMWNGRYEAVASCGGDDGA
jgi:hypothetical protein